LQEEELKYELETQIKQLIDEAEGSDQNEISKRICERIDWWLKNPLKLLLRSNQEHSNP
jgi:hypothetical protein